ncbi:MAG: class I SAM-dependent methyltransferase [Candidatus Odinarchaeota archaeon]
MTILLNRIKAWKNLFKLGKIGKFLHSWGEFIRNLVVLGLKDNFLSFLQQPHTFTEIKEEFNILDDDFLNLLLDTLLSDNTIEKSSNGFKLIKSLDIEAIPPKAFTKSINQFAESMSNSVFNRLFNKYYSISTGANLFISDDALSQRAYEIARRATISYVPNSINDPGRFLDLGCGSGTSTADLWTQIMKKHNFKPKSNFKLIGVEINEDFVNIANNEFYYIVKKYLEITEDAYSDFKPYHPEFKTGTTTQIPYSDNYFDYIYTSQVLHWTDLKSSLEEIYRCLKPGGVYFGANTLIPQANSYVNIMINTIEGVKGFFTKEEFKTVAKQVGFSKFNFCTPLTMYKFRK